MKKILVFIVAAVMLLSVCIPTIAAESITENNNSCEIEVHAKAVYILPDNMASSAVINGKAEATTTDGAKITVWADGNILDGLTLNVIEMVTSDKDAYAWISGVMKGTADKFTAYDIYFTDKNGNRVNISGSVTVTITTPDGYTASQVYHIDTNGKISSVASKQSRGNTEFEAISFSYYVLADKVDLNAPSQSIPQTGDAGNMLLWLTLALASGGVLIAIIRKRISKQTK